MKLAVRSFLVVAICVAATATVFAQRRSNHPTGPSIGGVYNGLTANPQSGDLDGMAVAIFAAGGQYRAVVQIAGGGAEDPAPHFVDVTVTGNKVEFKVDDTTYSGTISAAGLRLKDYGLLRRKTCTAFFSYGP